MLSVLLIPLPNRLRALAMSSETISGRKTPASTTASGVVTSATQSGVPPTKKLGASGAR